MFVSLTFIFIVWTSACTPAFSILPERNLDFAKLFGGLGGLVGGLGGISTRNRLLPPPTTSTTTTTTSKPFLTALIFERLFRLDSNFDDVDEFEEVTLKEEDYVEYSYDYENADESDEEDNDADTDIGPIQPDDEIEDQVESYTEKVNYDQSTENTAVEPMINNENLKEQSFSKDNNQTCWNQYDDDQKNSQKAFQNYPDFRSCNATNWENNQTDWEHNENNWENNQTAWDSTVKSLSDLKTENNNTASRPVSLLKGTQYKSSSYLQGGRGQFEIHGQGQQAVSGQGSFASQGFGVLQGAGLAVSQGQGFAARQEQEVVTQGEEVGVTEGQGVGVTQGEGVGLTQGEGVAVTGGQGVGVTQGQGVVVTQGQEVGVTRGQGNGVTQGQGAVVTQGQGFGVTQGEGVVVTQGEGVAVTQGQGVVVTQGEGVAVTQGEEVGVTEGEGNGVTQGHGVVVTQGQGFGVTQGQGVVVTRGQGVGVTEGEGVGVTQGQGVGVTQGQEVVVTQGQGVSVTRGQGVGVTEGQGVGVTKGQRSNSSVPNTSNTEEKKQQTQENERIKASKCCPLGRGYDINKRSCVRLRDRLKPNFLDGYQIKRLEGNDELKYHIDKDNILKCFGYEELTTVSDVSKLFYLTRNGELTVIFPSHRNPIENFPPHKYCIDNFVDGKSSTTDALFCYIKPEGHAHSTLSFVCMLVTCLLILMRVILFAWLPELRTLHGMILMAYLINFLIGFLLLAIIQLLYDWNLILQEVCTGISFIVYFSILSAFFWRNIMCYDIWWTFNCKRAFSSRGRNSSTRTRFIIYSVYAFGTPMALTVLLAGLEFSDLSRMHPFMPNLRIQGCFLKGISKLIYLYGPIILLFVINVIFSTLTAVKISAIKKETKNVLQSNESSTHDQQKATRRFSLYLKLFVAMAFLEVNWILEVIAIFAPDITKLLHISDIYNVLVPLIIFINFMSQKQTWRMMRKRYRQMKGLPTTGMLTSGTTQTQTTSTQDESESQVKQV
ncbi:unnamed protein product [Chrysodeixis includens]|uniref:G-protein coupled receptors family 2 profile 2 domain-containing protein n=1 Tax=Chrysodeixis includens TaxID=689277 RepID=A0A9P0BPA8_CHRIL|nr:unnamed protein product [Chrysodeixis includens]